MKTGKARNGHVIPSDANSNLTLSRLKTAPSRELKDAVKAKVAECFGEITVTSFTLFRSLLRPTGAVHEAVETYPMEGSC
jgi:2'-5' RNA ligase